MANYYGVMYVRFGAYSRDDACPEEEAAALKAVELDDSVAEAHQAPGPTRLFCDWDFQGAESELKRAIHLNPNYAEAHRVYADLLAFQGHGEKAVAEAERAVESDPMSPEINMILGWIYYLTHHYHRAIGQYQKAEGMDPDRPGNYWGLGNVYVQKGQLDLAIREFRKAVRLSSGAPWTLAFLGYAYASAGKRREAREILRQLDSMHKQCSVCTLRRALIWMRLGDRQRAFAWLEKAYDQHEWILLSVNADPAFDPLRSDPRFQDLERRVGR